MNSQTGVEKALIAIWRQALGVSTIQEEDNFFNLGGDTSLALRIVDQIRTSLRVDIPSNSLIENPTVKGLAQCLQSANRRTVKNVVAKQTKRSEYQASLAQSWLWLQYELEPENSAYNLFNTYRLHGSLDKEVLEQALLQLMERHQTLRTVFLSSEKGELRQQVVKPCLAITYENLGQFFGAEQDRRVRQLVESDVRRPFVLERGPLFRCLLIALSPNLHVLVLTAHHIVTDGWSQQVMIADLADLYHAISKHSSSTLPELKMQYGEFSEWQREWLSGHEWERQATYWKVQLAGAPSVLSLPTDHPRSVDADFCPAAVHKFSLGEQLSSRLRALSLSSRTTLFMTLLAGFQILIARYCWQDDLCVASPIANRPLKETEELIGFFVNTLVLRTKTEDNPPFSKFLSRTREIVLEALDHLAMPFDQVVSLLRPQRSPGSSPYAQVMFTLQNIPSRVAEGGELMYEPVTVTTGIPKFDISVVLNEKNDDKPEIAGYFSFNARLFEPATIERMAHCYVTLLNAAVEDTLCPVLQLRMLADQERKQTLQEWNHSIRLAAPTAAVSGIDGVAEASVAAVAAAPIDAAVSFPGWSRSMSHSRAYILDRFLQPVPPGAAGELYLISESSASGGDPDRDQPNREAVENLFGPGTLFRTNQLVHNLSDGRIEVIGNVAERSVVRNREMAPVEIQSTLEQIPDVARCAVAAGQNTMVCYVVPKKEAHSYLDRLRAELRNILARYTAASSLVFVPELLLASDGSPDFAKMADYEAWADGSTPLTPAQKILKDIWRNALGAETIGIHDNFFELGGNSLLAVRVATEARQQQLHIASRDLFRYQTIADLASHAKLAQPQLRRVSTDAKEWWPTSPIQRWFFSRSFFNPTLWNLSTLFKANGRIDVDLLRLAAERLVDRHIALRLQFRKHEGEWVQYVVDSSDDAFHSFNLSNLDPAAQLDEMVRIGSELQASFRFNHGTLIRFGFFDLGTHGSRLLIAAHHLVCDGFSMTVFMEDLASIYASFAASAPLQERETGNSFLEWTLLVHNPSILAQVVAKERFYWAPRKEVGLPYDFPDGENLVATVKRLRTELTPSETAELQVLARQKHHTSIEVLLVWGVASCIMDWKRERFAVLTMVAHGRESEWAHLDVSRTVGFFTVHYPLVLEIPDAAGNEDAIEAVRRQLDAVPNEGIGYGMLRFIYNQTYLQSSVPLQDEGEISFNYLGNYDLNLTSNGLFSVAQEKAGVGHDPRAENPYKLGCFGYILNGKLCTEWWFNTALQTSETINALADAYYAKLRSLLAT